MTTLTRALIRTYSGWLWSGRESSFITAVWHRTLTIISGEKNHGGQSWVNKPLGKCATASGLYPGGGFAERLVTVDPKPDGPDLKRIGAGGD